jgi:TonB-dependent starch-binding outer membrane protein SusC
MNRIRSSVLLGLMIAFLPTLLLGQNGTITGRVTDGSTSQPLVGAQVIVAGTNLGAITNQQGGFTIVNVPPGAREIRASLIGYNRGIQTLTVGSSQTVTANFALEQSVLLLEGLLVAATGQVQRRREVGNSVATIDVSQVELAPIRTFSQLLQGRAPGVSVMESAGTSGTGTRVRIRGSNSISLKNDPLLVIDGVRVEGASESMVFDAAGQGISRINDINPEEIANIEILKGPAASAMYGTAAANGVILITTKRGFAGTTQWNVYTTYGQIEDKNDYPANYRQTGTSNTTGATISCRILAQSAGTCTPTTMLSFNPLEENSPFRTGHNRSIGLNLGGGSDLVQYFVSGETEEEDGIFRNNYLDRINLRGNLAAQIHPTLDLSLNTGFVSSRTRLPYNDNAVEGIVSAGILGTVQEDANGGYFAYPLEHRYEFELFQSVERIYSSLNVNWGPLNWLVLNGTGGLDVLNRDDEDGIQPNVFTPDEVRGVYSSLLRNYTGRGNAVATFQLSDDLSSSTTAGGEYLERRIQRTDAWGYGMLPGTRSLGSLSERFGIDEFDERTRTVSVLGSQQFGWQDRIFVTGAMRGDRNSNFGSEFGFEWYPSVSLSWVLYEEPWFPETNLVNSFRARAAWGRSGLLPNFRTAEQFFSAEKATLQANSVPAITVGGAGNAFLRPERSTEFEVGFDAGLFDDRLGIDFSLYNKKTTDALVNRKLAPSLGSSEEQTVNLGSVSNKGMELQLDARILDTPDFGLDALLSFATNDNKLIELGEGVEDIVFGIGGDSQRHREEYPLGAYFYRPLESFADTNGNGLISASEVVVGDSVGFLGRPFPKREIALTTTVRLFGHVQASAMLDHRGGHHLFNSTEEFRCNVFLTCRGINDKSAPLDEQARAVASQASVGSSAGFIEDATFTKLREVSLTLGGLERFIQSAGITAADAVSLTFSGRNLKTWTDYTGLDPEINSGGQLNFNTFDFLGQPPVQSWSIRLDVGF